MQIPFKLVGSLILTSSLAFGLSPALAKDSLAKDSPVSAIRPLHYSYHHLLPLEGGSNFRDIGGYKTTNGKTVVRGELFRSGAMAGLTETDMSYLDQFHFQSVVDLRSSDEIKLFPNRWAQSRHIKYITYDYSMKDLANGSGAGSSKDGKPPSAQNFSLDAIYKVFPVMLKPQLTLYFDQLIAHKTPLVVNCSAGQDRTGTASALLLTALGVPRETVVEDYLLSTDYRNTANEMAGVDLKQTSDDNGFAKMMLRYKEDKGKTQRPEILKSPDGVPYINVFFDEVEKNYGSVAAYMEKELGVDSQDVVRLRSLYLQ